LYDDIYNNVGDTEKVDKTTSMFLYYTEALPGIQGKKQKIHKGFTQAGCHRAILTGYADTNAQTERI
jgi:hypothetical protein